MATDQNTIVRGETKQIFVRWSTNDTVETLGATNYGEIHILKDGDAAPTEYSTETATRWFSTGTGRGYFIIEATETDDYVEGEEITCVFWLTNTTFASDRKYPHGHVRFIVQDPATVALP